MLNALATWFATPSVPPESSIDFSSRMQSLSSRLDRYYAHPAMASSTDEFAELLSAFSRIYDAEERAKPSPSPRVDQERFELESVEALELFLRVESSVKPPRERKIGDFEKEWVDHLKEWVDHFKDLEGFFAATRCETGPVEAWLMELKFSLEASVWARMDERRETYNDLLRHAGEYLMEYKCGDRISQEVLVRTMFPFMVPVGVDEFETVFYGQCEVFRKNEVWTHVQVESNDVRRVNAVLAFRDGTLAISTDIDVIFDVSGVNLVNYQENCTYQVLPLLEQNLLCARITCKDDPWDVVHLIVSNVHHSMLKRKRRGEEITIVLDYFNFNGFRIVEEFTMLDNFTSFVTQKVMPLELTLHDLCNALHQLRASPKSKRKLVITDGFGCKFASQHDTTQLGITSIFFPFAPFILSDYVFLHTSFELNLETRKFIWFNEQLHARFFWEKDRLQVGVVCYDAACVENRVTWAHIVTADATTVEDMKPEEFIVKSEYMTFMQVMEQMQYVRCVDGFRFKMILDPRFYLPIRPRRRVRASAFCDFCFVPMSLGGMQICAGCASANYCGIECQLSAWKLHHHRFCGLLGKLTLHAYMSKE